MEQMLLDPAVRRDRGRVDALLAKDFEEIGASGRSWTREQILDLLATETYEAPAAEDFRCTMLADTVGLVTYRSWRRHPQTGAKTVVLRSSLWIRDSEVWRMRFHQGTPES